MKFNYFSAILCAVAVMGLFSCTKPEKGQDVINPDDEGIKTQFVLSISTAPSTKQSSQTAQAGASDPFRGIEDAFLLTMVQNENGKLLAADTDMGKLYDMSDAVTAGTITATNSRRVFEMSFPLKTNTMLFYGRAPQGEASGGLSANEIYGHLDQYTITETKGSALFQLGKRLQNSTEWSNKVEQFYSMETLLSGILTCIINTHMFVSDGTHGNIDNGNYHLDGTQTSLADGGYPNVSWKDFALSSGKSPVETTHMRYELENKLGRAYTQMTNIQAASGEIRAGSGEATLRTIQDLWTIVNEVRCAHPFSESEAVAARLATLIHTRMGTYFTASVPNDGGPVTDIQFNTMSDVIAAFANDVNGTKAVWPAEGAASKPSESTLSQMSTLISTLNPANFPQYFDLPRGAAYINFDSSKQIFFYPSSFNTTGMGGSTTGPQYNAESYYYPAELLYFGNSPIRATDTEYREVQYPGGNNASNVYNGAWTETSSWASWGNGNFVKSSTRSVAMVNEVNYGSALLQTQVKYAATTLLDNNHAIQVARDNTLGDNDEPDKSIIVNENSFKLTGIVIGGVHQNVGWDYLPCKVDVGGTMKDIDGFIYDKCIPDAARNIPVTGTSAPNYTLVFDNFKGTLDETTGIWIADAHQDKVYVALEFLNNTGSDFYGNCNIIRNGGYFYLIGELDPEKVGLTPAEFPADGASDKMVHRIPPYNEDGTSQKIQRVFIEDYLTKATFTIGANSLKHAYLTTPDLRSSSMTFGLSVDLDWSTGIDFGEVLLGGN